MADSRRSLMVVDDEEHILSTLSQLLERDYEVVTASSVQEATEVLRRRSVDLILCDQKMPGGTGVQLLEWAHRERPKSIRLLMTGYAELEDVLEAINRGHVYRYVFKPWRTEELHDVLQDAARAFHQQQNHELLLSELRSLNEELEKRVEQRTAELAEVNRQLQQKNSLLERLALTDDLTGLFNRRAIEQFLESEIRRRGRYASPLAVGLIDADHFKDINTRFLYPGGDQVLIDIAKLMSSLLRGVDAIGRMGGEEFLIVAPETDLGGAYILSERIRRAIEKSRTRYQEQEIRVTISVGFVVADERTPAEFNQLIHQSAVALNEAKARGRNRSVVLPFLENPKQKMQVLDNSPSEVPSASALQ